ncbi:hypothetical protein Vadar_034430 [Vaccinium darrowii]|uniref:Uncharacterized protein n=1 Tax=Vaccinium darrowii TaxID=229202 RepID=A0ACB7X6G6_9ERIC|nr:hypothetical protein Vadar_034430 [Vaccinium darrowii]
MEILISILPSLWLFFGCLVAVDLPPWFSSMSVALDSDVALKPESVKEVPTSRLPMICLREGDPPVPDAYISSSIGLGKGYSVTQKLL